VFLIVSGVTEFIVPEMGINNKMAGGSIIGELSGLLGTEARGTYRAVSIVQAICISSKLYVEVLKRNGLYDETRRHIAVRRFLQNTWLFGEQLSCPVKNRISNAMTLRKYMPNEYLSVSHGAPLYLVKQGEVEVMAGRNHADTITEGGFFGEENVLFGGAEILSARVLSQAEIWEIPADVVSEIPIVRWKLRETFERRVRMGGGGFIFA